MSSRIVAALALLALAVAPGAARAAEALGVLAVDDPPGPGAELAQATEKLRAALAERVPGVLGAAALRERMTGRPPPSSLAELERAYAGAVAAHAAGEFERSIGTLGAVIDALEAMPESAEAFAQWTRAMLRLARSHQELGRRVEAQGVLERLLRAAPDARADARQYPPSFVTLVEESRARLRSLGARKLTVESKPDARIFVDGREVGTSPVTVALAPGRYRVAGLRDGVRAPPVVADLSSEDRVVRLDMTDVAALRPDAGPGLALAAPDRALGIVTAGSRLALDRAVATTLLRDGEAAYLVATIHDLRRGTVEREGRLRLVGGASEEGIAALATFLATGRASSLVSTPTGPSLALHASPRDADPLALAAAPGRWREGYVAAGVLTGLASAVGAFATVLIADNARSKYAEARGMLDANGQLKPGADASYYNDRIHDGDALRINAIEMAIATGVSVAVTGILFRHARGPADPPGTIRF